MNNKKTQFIFQTESGCNSSVKKSLESFYKLIPTLEKELNTPLLILYDFKTEIFYTECHIRKQDFINLVDTNAEIDPEFQEGYKLNRDLQPTNFDFKTMEEDAKKGRQFSDIVVEYNEEYRAEKPLKILGGQHRTAAIEQKSPNESVHGFRIYFNLNKDKRAEIARISNTNIDISPDLLDRMEEQRLEPPNKLRDFAHKIGLLEKGKDFGDARSNVKNLPTVRLARTFILNFYQGINYDGNFDNDAIEGYICVSSGMDQQYEKIYKSVEDFMSERALIKAGENFVSLHKKQFKTASKKSAQQGASKMKAVAYAVISAWATVAGLLQKDQKRLEKFYNLPHSSGKGDPLNTKEMSEFSFKGVDPEAYRGLGTRSDAKERGRLIMVFLDYSKSTSGDKIDKILLDRAVRYYHSNKMRKEGDKYK